MLSMPSAAHYCIASQTQIQWHHRYEDCIFTSSLSAFRLCSSFLRSSLAALRLPTTVSWACVKLPCVAVLCMRCCRRSLSSLNISSCAHNNNN